MRLSVSPCEEVPVMNPYGQPKPPKVGRCMLTLSNPR